MTSRNLVAAAIAITLQRHLAEHLEGLRTGDVRLETVVLNDRDEPIVSVGVITQFFDGDHYEDEVKYLDLFLRPAQDDEEYFAEIEEAYEVWDHAKLADDHCALCNCTMVRDEEGDWVHAPSPGVYLATCPT